MDQNYPEGQPRKVIVTGRQDGVMRATKMISELINGEPGSAQSIIQKVRAVWRCCNESVVSAAKMISELIRGKPSSAQSII